MRAFAALGAAVFHSLVRQANAHPLCYYDDKPTDPDAELVFCPEQPEYGACCNDLEETAAISLYLSYNPNGTALSSDCAAFYRQVACGPCNSFAAHLYEVLGSELGPEDGMTMTYDFCEALTTACDGQIEFETYDGESYCEKHTLGSTGPATDSYWSYPLTEDKTSFQTAGLDDAFPDLDDSELPSDLICMHMTLDGTEWWLGGQDGQIVKVISQGPTSSTEVVDLSSGVDLYVAYEEGLLDFAFSPAFETNNYFYVSYTILDTEGAKNRLSRFTYSSTPAATLASIDVILTSEAKATSIHSAGWVGFKPSDYASSSESSHDIYWAIGDGGPQTDTLGVGQDTSNLLGSIVRVSVPSGTSASDVGYTIPSGNYDGVREEICAPGFRNPFRCGFDKATDDLYCGDVGHTMVEEVDIVVCGENYGWAKFEGSRCQEAAEGLYGACDGTSRSGYTFPIYEYCHTDYFSTDAAEAEFTDGVDICGNRGVVGFAVIGGVVYHGQKFSDVLEGAYIFGDVQMQKIFYLTQTDGMWTPGVILSDDAPVISFAEDNDGEVFVITAGNPRKPYTLPCGDLCATTCLEQSETLVTFESQGCYADVANNRALQLQQAPSCGEGENAMSPQICASYCETVEDAVYFGVQYAEECFCGAAGEDYAKHGALDDFSCTYFCIGNTEYFCGGQNAIEVYEFESAPTPSFAPVSVPPIPTVAPGLLVPMPTLPPGPVTPSPTEATPMPMPSSGGTPSPSSNEYFYLGCYGDAAARVLTGSSTSSASMTIEFCAAYCEGSQYFGTQYSQQCYCSAAGDEYDEYGEVTCSSACAGDSSQTCGGSYAMSMYEYAEYSPPPTSTPLDFGYVGCYGDAADRVFSGASTASSSMTSNFCASFCQGSDFFGTEYGSECYCSAVGDDYEEYGTATCSDPCAGSSSEICGDSYAISVYEYDSGSPSPGLPTPAPGAPTPVPTGIAPTPVPTDAAAPTPAPAPSMVLTYTPLGCYTDSQSDRLLDADSTSASLMTTELCEQFCVGYTYFGTEFGNECFCGSPASLGTDLATNCNMDCAGDSSQTCGGHNAINVYEYTETGPTPAPVDVTEPTPVPTVVTEPTPVPASPTALSYVAVDCYTDSSSDRLLSADSTSTALMTTEYCESFCIGYTYFGTEFGSQCFCGSPASLGTDLATNCNMDCAGDSSQTCGGHNAINVYEYTETGPTPVPPTPAEPTPAPVDVTEPTPAPTPGTSLTFTSQGCYVDSQSARVLSGLSFSTGLMTIELCESFCAGYTYFGTEFGQECFCGSPASLSSATSTSCTMDCAGDASQTCGGRNAINVYEYTGVTNTDYTYLGCFTDDTSNRVMDDMTTSSSMTLDLCASTCASSTYFGTEGGNECFCGNNDGYDELGASTSCTSPCLGDTTKICGGVEALSVYAQ